ncbi:unnamed protein product, partial [Acanthocheilonema viteae]
MTPSAEVQCHLMAFLKHSALVSLFHHCHLPQPPTHPAPLVAANKPLVHQLPILGHRPGPPKCEKACKPLRASMTESVSQPQDCDACIRTTCLHRSLPGRCQDWRSAPGPGGIAVAIGGTTSDESSGDSFVTKGVLGQSTTCSIASTSSLGCLSDRSSSIPSPRHFQTPPPEYSRRHRPYPSVSSARHSRAAHNELEKTRRANLRGYLDNLKDIVPSSSDNARNTTLSLLTRARDYIL